MTVFVTCLNCNAAARQSPYVDPNGWFYIRETGWACPKHAIEAADAELCRADEKIRQLQNQLRMVKEDANKKAETISKLRDGLNRIVAIYDDYALEYAELGDHMLGPAVAVLSETTP